MALELFTIGHSNHPLRRFMELLALHAIQALCDVRSTPYSRFNPQFNRESLATALGEGRIAYLYLGEELGGKPREPDYPTDEKARFARIAESQRFRAGLERLLAEAAARRTAMMCAEKDPARCHRGLLICPNLPEGVMVRHILADGSLVDQRDLQGDAGSEDPRQPSLL